MLRIYHKRSCNSSLRALGWFDQYQIKVNKQRMSQISKKELFYLLSLTDRGLEDILKRPGKCSPSNRQRLDNLKSMTVSEAIDYLIKHIDLLQSPIIIQGRKFLIGYNADEIRKFLPKEYRRNNLS